MERNTTFVVAWQFFETALKIEEVKKNIFTNTPVPIILHTQTTTRYPNVVLAPLTVENGIAFIDRSNVEVLEDWVAKYEAEQKAEEERQAERAKVAKERLEAEENKEDAPLEDKAE